MDFLLKYERTLIQFFCFAKPLGIALRCFDNPKPMLLPQKLYDFDEF